jgi:hypothetical protein
MINPKNINAYQAQETVDVFMFFSNELRPVVIERGDRRFSIFKVHGKIPVTLGKRVADDARANGPIVAAFLDMLLKRASKVKPFDPPFDSDEKKSLEVASGNSAEKFAYEIIERGFDAVTGPWLSRKTDEAERRASPTELTYVTEQTMRDGSLTRWVPRHTLVDIYTAWCASNRFQALASTNLYSTMADMIPGFIPEKNIKVNKQTVRHVGGLPWKGQTPDIDLDAPDVLAEYQAAKRAAEYAASTLEKAEEALVRAMATDPAVKVAVEAQRTAEMKLKKMYADNHDDFLAIAA